MESEFEIASTTVYVMYGMDNEDEEWVAKLNSMSVGDEVFQCSQVLEETYEKIMR